MPKEPPAKVFMEFDEDDPRFQVRVLSYRVDALTKEKEDIESDYRKLNDRVAAMERTFHRGAAAMLVLPFIGAAIGLLLSYGKLIFAPWTGGR